MMTAIKVEDVQGIVFSGYAKSMRCASYYMLQIDDAAKVRKWIQQLVSQEKITHGGHRGTTWCLNLALTYSGFEKLELEPDSLESFEHAFREGMNSKRRSKILSDWDANSPEKWDWGINDTAVDVMLMLFSADETIHNERHEIEQENFTTGGLHLITRLQASSTSKKTKEGLVQEHFGFADGLSQPAISGFPQGSNPASNPSLIPAVAPGEFLLGYPNEYKAKTQIPSAGELAGEFGVNGTYLVFRQLEQDVAGFWESINTAALAVEKEPEFVASKIVGRWPNGALVLPDDVRNPNTAPTNNFDFTSDPDGLGCPIGSHIRRSNPRAVGLGATPKDSVKVLNRHRIVRRGRSYGPPIEDPNHDDNQKRGLFFICLNANIERQFEFVQHTWINNVKFGGLYDEDDALIGSYVKNEKNFTIPDTPVRQHIKGLGSFVTTRGGAYFFLPGIRALKMLGDM